jgi:hypothetical protein
MLISLEEPRNHGGRPNMATRHFKVTVTDGRRQYVATGDVTTAAKNPSALAQRKAMNAIVEKFPELRNDTLRVEDVAESNSHVAPFRVMTDEESADQRRRVMLWRLANKAKVEPMAELVKRVEKYAEMRRFAGVAEGLAWSGETAMKTDIERAWAETILTSLRDEGATYFDARPEFERSGGYRVADVIKFDEIVGTFTKSTLKRALHVESTSTSDFHNVKARMERDVAASVYEFLTEGGLF